MGTQKEMVLVRDVVIPAGTRLARAPSKQELDDSHFEALVGFGADNTASFTISLDDLPEGIAAELV